MMDMTDEQQLNHSNRAVFQQFDIHPARGVLPNDGAETFSVTFTPVRVTNRKHARRIDD